MEISLSGYPSRWSLYRVRRNRLGRPGRYSVLWATTAVTHSTRKYTAELAVREPERKTHARQAACGTGAMRHSAPPQSRLRRQHRAAAAGRLRWQQLPYMIVICCLVLVLVWMRQSGQNVRGGTLAVAGILFAAALARLALPERRIGMLASRRRLTDVAVLAALGTGLLVAGLLLPAQP